MEPMLAEVGLATERRPSPVGPHLLAYGNKSPQVLLMGHIDTVFPAGTAAARPFRLEGNRAYGPGVIDMKSGIVNLIYVVKALAAAGGLHEHVRVVINADEEISSIHSRELIYEQSRLCRAAFVFEPSPDMETLTTSRKGVGDMTLSVTGKAAHAGRGYRRRLERRGGTGPQNLGPACPDRFGAGALRQRRHRLRRHRPQRRRGTGHRPHRLAIC